MKSSRLCIYTLQQKTEADKNDVCSIPEITEILPRDKLRHTEEKGEMNSAHPCFTSYTSQLSAAQIAEKQTWWCCLFWLLFSGLLHIKQLCIKHKKLSGVLEGGPTLSTVCARLWDV